MDAVAVHSGEYVEFFNELALDRVANLVPRMSVRDTDAVADFGCGNGMLLEALGPRSGGYDGVDFSPDFIRAAIKRASGSNYRFHCQDIVEFCAEHKGKFDIAATLDFSEHVDDETFVRIYSAIRRSLKPNGRLYLHTPNAAFFMERLKARGILEQLRGHIAVRDAKDNERLLRASGFGSITIERVAHYNILRHLHLLSRLSDFFAARLWVTATP